jgi:MFS transporter, NNP family, nitrate/nitrite transporter
MEPLAVRNVFDDSAAGGRGPMSTVVVAVGFAVTSWVWALVASAPAGLAALFGGGGSEQVPVVVLSLVLAAVGRMAAGVCTDRYGAQVMLPMISVAAAALLMLAAVVEPGLVWITLACAAGVAGAVFPVGTAAVARAHPLEGRGRALAICGAGVLLGAVTATMTGPIVLNGDPYRLVLATVPLVGFAVVAAVLVCDCGQLTDGRRAGGRLLGTRAQGRSTSSLAVLYAAAFGAVLAMAMFLPVYLRAEYRLDEGLILAATSGCVVIAALVRPVGGWLADRGASARTLVGCFTVAGGCVLVQAFAPPLPWCALTLGGTALCLGMASGTVLALIGILAPPERVGTVAGTVGAIGAIAGLAPPALLAAVYAADGSFGIAMTVLAALLILAAFRAQQLESALATRSSTAILATATQELVDEVDSVDYLHQVTTWCVHLPQVDAAGLLTADHRGNLRLVACSVERATLTQLLEYQHDGPVRDCLRTGTPMHDTELATSITPWQRFAALAEWAGFASVCALPMRLSGRTVGVLTLLSERPGELSSTDLPAAQALADLAAIALLRDNSNRSLTDAAREVINSWLPSPSDTPRREHRDRRE